MVTEFIRHARPKTVKVIASLLLLPEHRQTVKKLALGGLLPVYFIICMDASGRKSWASSYLIKIGWNNMSVLGEGHSIFINLGP
jgi:hypothetical protein